jgi:hypothetical protein
MQAVINDTTVIYVQDDSPNAESRYRMRFYFDPNSISMANNNVHNIFIGYAGTTTAVVQIELRYYSGSYQLRADARDDGGTWRYASYVTLTDGPHFIELDWKAATAAGANDGVLTLWIDGVQRTSLTTLDTDTRRIDRARLGAVGSLDVGTSGTYYFDAFESRMASYIGP